jgi:hypothetical protein
LRNHPGFVPFHRRGDPQGKKGSGWGKPEKPPRQYWIYIQYCLGPGTLG